MSWRVSIIQHHDIKLACTSLVAIFTIIHEYWKTCLPFSSCLSRRIGQRKELGCRLHELDTTDILWRQNVLTSLHTSTATFEARYLQLLIISAQLYGVQSSGSTTDPHAFEEEARYHLHMAPLTKKNVTISDLRLRQQLPPLALLALQLALQ